MALDDREGVSWGNQAHEVNILGIIIARVFWLVLVQVFQGGGEVNSLAVVTVP